jgi:DHA1 family quinolone resistance protein-like MFS transporter
MNRTIKLLILSDIFLVTGFGLSDPIMAVYIKENLIGGTLIAAGVASSIFLFTKSILQIPLSKYVDKHEHRVFFLILGTIFVSFVPFIYAHSNHINHIYFAQFLHGIGSAMAVPTWLSLFSMHLDKKKEAYQWSCYSTTVGLGTAASAYIGARLAGIIGFQLVFYIVGLLSLVGVAILFFLEMKHKEKIRFKGILEKTKLFGDHHFRHN